MTQRTPAPWMLDENAQKVMAALGEARFVGGCVRDWLLDRRVKDIDIATPLLPEEIVKRCAAAGLKTVPTGIDHGTVTAISGGRGFEITTLRKDIETDGRRAVVKFSTDWADDAERRDFTINALYADQDGSVYDPTKLGLADIQKRRLRFVGEPTARIKEDYLRILRYFRFAAQLGWELDDAAALHACRKSAPHLNELSKERVTQEILKLLAAPKPVPVLWLMAENNILPDLFAGLDWNAFERLCSYTPNNLTRLSMLFNVEKRFVLSNAQKDFLKNFSAVSIGADISAIKKLIYYQGNERAQEIYLRRCAIKGWAPDKDVLALLSDWQAPIFPVSGDDLIKQGMAPGPELGAKLKALEEEWLEQICS